MPLQTALTFVEAPLERVSSGKVREVFRVDETSLLFVATDRVSAFDVVMTRGIADKGKVLTAMSLFWFDLLADVCPNHLLSPTPPHGVDAQLSGRSMIVKELDMLPIEFVVRGYLAGSAYKEYSATSAVCGVRLPPGLIRSDRLPEPLFTPATKAETGHDENISEDMAADIVGPDILKIARGYAVALYKRASEYAQSRGIILADTKFEFGLDPSGEVTLGDEVLTPDSSRFWPAATWAPGTEPASFDKQYLRDWLDSVGWDHVPPPPDIPDDVAAKTRAKYIEAYESLTSLSFDDYLQEAG